MNKHVFQNTNQLRAALRQRFATVEHTPADNINMEREYFSRLGR